MRISNFAAIAALCVSPALAQQAQPQGNQRAQPHETNKAETNENEEGYHSDRALPQGLVRASEMINAAIYNGKDEQVASVYDIVMDEKSGKVSYVAVSAGGVLGMGDKLFAVPHDAFQKKMMDGERVCVLDVPEDAFANARGFDQENWPTKADDNWKSSLRGQDSSSDQRLNSQQNRPRPQRPSDR